MADITLTYKGATIAEISETGTKTIETAGKYCEADIGLAYVKPGGGGEDTLDKLFKNTLTTFATDATGSIESRFFYGKTALVSMTFSEMDGAVGPYAFSGCTGLETLILPKITSCDEYSFYNLPSLEVLHLSSMTTAKNYSFGRIGSSSHHSVIVLPAISGGVGTTDTFRGTGGYYAAIDIGPGATAIPQRSFYQGTYEKIILRASSVVALNNTNAADSLTSSTVIYVPSALISSYEGATNWSTAKASHGFSFAAIEGSDYETQYADGTPISS